MEESPVAVLETINGRAQVSWDDESIGFLLERDGRSVGVLLTHEQAEYIAKLLAREPRSWTHNA